MRRRTLIPAVAIAAAPAAMRRAGASPETMTMTMTATAQGDRHPAVGAWLVREMLPPDGGQPPLFFALTLHADDTASASGFGGFAAGAQGAWQANADGTATFTLVGATVGANGPSGDGYELLKATITIDGDAFTGGYETNSISLRTGAPEVQFVYMGPLAGQRILVEAPDAKAMTIEPGA